MIVNLENKKYHITWKHLVDQQHQPGLTECIISEIKSDGEYVAFVQASARCSAKDNYNKNTGRKLSLHRAICAQVPIDPQQTNPKEWAPIFSKKERLDIWKEYFRMRHEKF